MVTEGSRVHDHHGREHGDRWAGAIDKNVHSGLQAKDTERNWAWHKLLQPKPTPCDTPPPTKPWLLILSEEFHQL